VINNLNFKTARFNSERRNIARPNIPFIQPQCQIQKDIVINYYFLYVLHGDGIGRKKAIAVINECQAFQLMLM
jgi:hypothetical protein